MVRGLGYETHGVAGRKGEGPAYHLVNSLHDLEHLVVADLAVAVNVVELERPVELVLHLAPGGDAQRADELLEVDGPGLVAVKHVEDIICETRGVAEREELPVDLLELVLGEHARGAVLEEACALSRAPAYCQPPIPSRPAAECGVIPALPVMVWRGVLRACHTALGGSWVSLLLRHQEPDLSGDIGDKLRIEDEDVGGGATTVGGHDGDVPRGGNNEIMRTLVPLLQLLLVKVC